MTGKLDQATEAVVSVDEGRGFILETNAHLIDRVVVTAAHCLPDRPGGFSIGTIVDRTYPNLLGLLGGSGNTVCAECIFIDLIADIAVLVAPDNQSLPEEAEAFEELTESVVPLRMGKVSGDSPAWLLSLDNRWTQCTARGTSRAIWITNADGGIIGGMSGSPIISDDGKAIGVLCASGGEPGNVHSEGGPQVQLTEHLPGWLLKICDW